MDTANTRLAPRARRPRWQAQLAQCAPLDAAEERALATRAREGDREARDRLVASQLRLVLRYAQRAHRGAIPLEELVSEGTIGLLEAARRYEPSRGTRFSTYAVPWIRNFVLERVAREADPLGVGKGVFGTKYWFRTRRELTRLYNQGVPRDELVDALAAALELSRERTEEMLAQLRRHTVPSDVRETPTGRVGVELPSATPAPETLVADKQRSEILVERVERAIARLPEREQMLVRRRLMSDEPATLRELGEELGISRERTRQLELRARERLRRELRGLGRGASGAKRS